MEHRTHNEIARVAAFHETTDLSEPMSREERLRRWITLLEMKRDRTLQTLHETEFKPVEVRDRMRADNSAITVAFEDPLLRAEGLAGDTYADARMFFGLSDGELHHVVCYCHGGAFMWADTAAYRLRSYLPGSMESGLFRRVWNFLTDWR